MESVMNFLADYYYIFFIAAGVLFFALVGFIIESKKKQKNDFKGEEIVENTEVPSMPDDVTVVGNTVDMNGTTSIEEAKSDLEDTIEINDIPVREEPTEEKIEFYSGPVDMPVVEEAPNYVEEMNNATYEEVAPVESNNIFTEEVEEIESFNPEEIAPTENLEEQAPVVDNDSVYSAPEEIKEEFNIFDDIK